MTEEEARALITRLLGTRNQIALYPFEFGWAAQEILSEQERARGMNIGQGTFIIDRATGVVTAQTSLPVDLIMEEYTEARREGRIQGLQVWPETAGPATAPDSTGPTNTP